MTLKAWFLPTAGALVLSTAAAPLDTETFEASLYPQKVMVGGHLLAPRPPTNTTAMKLLIDGYMGEQADDVRETPFLLAKMVIKPQPTNKTQEPISNASETNATPPGVEAPSSHVQKVQAYLLEHREGHCLRQPAEQLRLLSENQDRVGLWHLKFQQVYKGVDVWLHQVYAHINKDGKIYKFDDGSACLPDDLSVSPALTAEQAAMLVPQIMRDRGAGWKATGTQLYVYVGDNKRPVLAYWNDASQGMNRRFLIVDANTGVLLDSIEGTISSQ
jgi:Zn-dependent metalloprotease